VKLHNVKAWGVDLKKLYPVGPHVDMPITAAHSGDRFAIKTRQVLIRIPSQRWTAERAQTGRETAMPRDQKSGTDDHEPYT
jgi:hypothetical protein